jgi:hypothetical protein
MIHFARLAVWAAVVVALGGQAAPPKEGTLRLLADAAAPELLTIYSLERKISNLSITPADFIDRSSIGSPDSCQCCCCGPLVANATLINSRSATLDALLEQHGVLNCAGLAQALDSGKDKLFEAGFQTGFQGGKQGTTAMRTGALRDGRAVMIYNCSDCAKLGVGTLIATRESPFTMDLHGYCPPSERDEDGHPATFDGMIVTELMEV